MDNLHQSLRAMWLKDFPIIKKINFHAQTPIRAVAAVGGVNRVFNVQFFDNAG